MAEISRNLQQTVRGSANAPGGRTPASAGWLSHVRGRMPVCDGIRGVAILMVIVVHTYAARFPIPLFMAHVYSIGWIGVDIFFVLSGFLITGILLDTKGGGYFTKFYARRALRIVPQYYALLALCFVVLPILADQLPRQFAESIASPSMTATAWYFSFTSNFGKAVFGLRPVEALGVVWSLAIEEQFYLLWPLVAWLSSARNLLRICCAVVVSTVTRVALVLAGFDGYSVYTLTITRCNGLALGAIVAACYRDATLSTFCKSYAIVALPIGLLAFLGASIYQGRFNSTGAPMQLVGYTGVALVAGASLVFALESDMADRGGLSRVLRLRALTWPASFCYGLYLTHALNILPMRPIFLDHLGLDWHRHPVLVQLSFTIVALALCFPLAQCVWTLIEAPILQFKSKFEYERR